MTTLKVSKAPVEVLEADLGKDEAQQIVDSIRADLSTLRGRIYALWSRKGWKALGYGTWEAFCGGEFPELADRTMRQYVAAAQVERLVSPRTGATAPELPERVLRPLVRFKDTPDILLELWGEAVKRAVAAGKDRPTMGIVEAVVADHTTAQDEADWPEDQLRRRRVVEAGGTVVANQHTQSDDSILIKWATENECLVGIGRGTPWGNPFVIPEDGERDTVCDSYEVYFGLKFSLHDRVVGLKGKVLACWCYPERCHGDYLVTCSKEV